MVSGILNIYKPSGITSSDVVGIVRKKLGIKAVGHMGTLDPIGEGVLLVGVGKGTRLFDYFLKKRKTYEATFLFGAETDTLDRTGAVIKTTTVVPSQQEIENACKKMIGAQPQLPPAYSAKSVGGVRAYALARQGKEVSLRPANIEIYDMYLKEAVRKNEYRFVIDCSAGTYIRSICRDLAYSTGSLANMTSIKRVKAGPYEASDGVNPSEVSWSDVIPLEKALFELPRVDFPAEMYKKISNGVGVECSEQFSAFRMYCDGILFGIGSIKNGLAKISVYLKED